MEVTIDGAMKSMGGVVCVNARHLTIEVEVRRKTMQNQVPARSRGRVQYAA